MSESDNDAQPPPRAAVAANGASACFVGSTRGTFKGKRVVHLAYECYVPMAERVMRKVCVEAIATCGASRVAVRVHPGTHPHRDTGGLWRGYSCPSDSMKEEATRIASAAGGASSARSPAKNT